MISEKEDLSEWTEVLTKERPWFSLNLADVWRYRDLIWLFFRRDFVSSYKQTVLGPLWFVLPPLFTTFVMSMIFGRVAKIGTDGTPYSLFFILGWTAWSYFASCLNKTASTFTSNAGLFGKVYFPRLTVPMSIVLNNLATFAIQFTIFLCMFAYWWWHGVVSPNWRVLILPILLVQMAALGLGLGCIVSALTTRYRDLAMAVGFGVQMWMYVSCVVFPLKSVAEHQRWIFILNPMVPIIESFRFAFLGKGVIEMWHLGISFAMSMASLAIGLLMFNHVEKTFTDTV